MIGEDWLKTRPEWVQKLASEFPLGTVIDVDGYDHYLIGYTEGDEVVISPISPFEDFDAAYKERMILCAEHLRVRAN
jgi:hypothetical protein